MIEKITKTADRLEGEARATVIRIADEALAICMERKYKREDIHVAVRERMYGQRNIKREEFGNFMRLAIGLCNANFGTASRRYAVDNNANVIDTQKNLTVMGVLRDSKYTADEIEDMFGSQKKWIEEQMEMGLSIEEMLDTGVITPGEVYAYGLE